MYKRKRKKGVEKYTVYFICFNCGSKTQEEIIKGVTVQDFIKGEECCCENCGLKFYPTEYTTKEFKNNEKK